MEFAGVVRVNLSRASTVAVIGRFVGLAIGMLLATTACSAPPEPTSAGAQLSGYNHTPDYIHQYYVDGAYGGNVQPYGGGGSFTCCVMYPRQWREGLQARVKWTTSDADPNGSPEEAWHEKLVTVDRYTELGTTMNVHFLPGGEVRLVVTSKRAHHPEYPGPPAPEMPDDFPFK